MPKNTQIVLLNQWDFNKRWSDISGEHKAKFNSFRHRFPFPFSVEFSFNKPTEPTQNYVTIQCKLTFNDKKPNPNHYLTVEFDSSTKPNPQSPLKQNFTLSFADDLQTYTRNFTFSRFRYDTVFEENFIMHFTFVYHKDNYKEEKPAHLPYKGIQRPSNSCYINVIIQMLFHLTAFQLFVNIRDMQTRQYQQY